MNTFLEINFVSDIPAHDGVAIIAVAEKAAPCGDAATAYIQASAQVYDAACKAHDFSGQSGRHFSLYSLAASKIDQLSVQGIGPKDKFNAEMFSANMIKAFLQAGSKKLTLHLGGCDLEAEQVAQAALGAHLAAYRFDHYRTKLPEDKKTTLQTINISCEDPKAANRAYTRFYESVADGIYMARDLVNEPPNRLYPASYAERILELRSLGLDIEVLDEDTMQDLGMNALLGVGRGSVRESQCVIMKWQGGKPKEKPVCLIGKGVTFDTGGISLKPGANMWDMKADMGGSAAVVGAMAALATRKAKVNVIGLVGLVENMPDGQAQLPGDIVTSMSGQTIEVQNTDAEGRLVLADILHYAHKTYAPQSMVDLATLTGAIIVSLGHDYAGLFSNNDELAAGLSAAGTKSTERVWRMPLNKAYDKLVDSQVADMKNISSGSAAASITAAQFLQRFVGETAWAHLDIAGTAMKNTRPDSREPTFGTGFGVRLLNQWIADRYES